MIFLPLIVSNIFARLCFAQDAIGFLTSYSELSDFTSLVKSHPGFLNQLQNTTNYTLLAPTNSALSQWRNGSVFYMIERANSTDYFIEATLEYHLLKGKYAFADFSNQPQFIASMLSDPNWSMVTGGQPLEAMKTPNLTFVSGLQTPSHFLFGDLLAGNDNSSFEGVAGIIHVIDAVLEVAADLITTAKLLSLSDLLSIMNHWTTWPSYNGTLVNETLNARDQTYFLPNSAAALVATVNASPDTQNHLDKLLSYSIVSGSVLYSTALTNGTILTTLSGLPLVVTVLDDEIYINSAKILTADGILCNGVYHLLDNVLIPGNTTGPVVPVSITPTAYPSTSTNLSVQTSKPTHSPGPNKKLPESTDIGIGVGIPVTVIVLAIIGVFTLKSSRSQKVKESSLRQELSGSNYTEAVQLESHERPVEVEAS